MGDLFGDNGNTVPGLGYYPDYIDRGMETELIERVIGNTWIDDLRRRVQHYGYRYDYKARQISPASFIGALPKWLADWSNRLSDEGFYAEPPDQVIVNEYLPGQGIASHVDRVHCFGDPIAILSLGSSCVMDFTHTTTGEKIPLALANCSLAVMSEESRYQWEHGIRPRKSDIISGEKIDRGRRISITFRKVILTH